MAESELLALVSAADVAVTSYPHGGVIFVKDDDPGHAYVVKSGRVEIREAGRLLEGIEPGEIFGEVGMIDRGPRSASAVAVGPTDLYVIDRPTFDSLVRDNPVFAAAIMRDMARRLRATNQRYRPSNPLPIVSPPSRSA
jgi:CRP/FNR family transcriptional regulator, cyclic AMP receptor protein